MLERTHLIACLVVAAASPALAANAPGIKNFDQVDAHVYRGAQPTAEGFRYLAGIGVKTVIDLREDEGRAKVEERMVRDAGMVYLNVPMTGLTPPSEAELLKVLTVLENVTVGPVFVHCFRGADRTGAVIAAYHIEHDQWDTARALKDAKAHGMGTFQIPRQNFIKNYLPLTMNAKNAAKGDSSVSTSATPAAVSASH
jgi:protein-tyrosine phosphatase